MLSWMTILMLDRTLAVNKTLPLYVRLQRGKVGGNSGDEQNVLDEKVTSFIRMCSNNRSCILFFDLSMHTRFLTVANIGSSHHHAFISPVHHVLFFLHHHHCLIGHHHDSPDSSCNHIVLRRTSIRRFSSL